MADHGTHNEATPEPADEPARPIPPLSARSRPTGSSSAEPLSGQAGSPGADEARSLGPTDPRGDSSRRKHTPGRLTTAIAVLALATAAYGLLRLDATRDRLDQVNDAARMLEAERSVLRSELTALARREEQSTRELERRLDALADMPRLTQDLAASVEELRGRAEGPERAWSRAEAAFLLELAQRRLVLERDIDTALVALESADSRLAALRDPSFDPIRQQIARELQALHAVQRPDTTGVLSRVAGLEERIASLPVKGIVPAERMSNPASLPEGTFSRAWAMARASLANLIAVREVQEGAARVLTADQALLRREHLQLLMFAARNAIARHDAAGFRGSLAKARQWLTEFFDLSSPATQAVLKEIQALEPIDIAPALPDISGSSRALRRLMPSGSAASSSP